MYIAKSPFKVRHAGIISPYYFMYIWLLTPYKRHWPDYKHGRCLHYDTPLCPYSDTSFVDRCKPSAIGTVFWGSLQERHNGRDGVSQTSVLVVCSTVCSGADQRTHQSFASLAFVRGIHRWPVVSPHKGPVTRKMVPFENVSMIVSVAWGTNVLENWQLTRLILALCKKDPRLNCGLFAFHCARTSK